MIRQSFQYISRFLFLLVLVAQGGEALSKGTWQEALVNKDAQLDLYWFTSSPFIYKDASGKLTGIEYDLLDAFADYVSDQHDVEVSLNWIEANNFNQIIDLIQDDNQRLNSLGVSAFSITEERGKIVAFTDPYFPDVTVLVSSQGSSIVDTYDEIHQMMSQMTAVTIKGTTYESLLFDLKRNLKAEFEILYIDSDENVLDYISRSSERFGFIDLPIYLMLVEQGGELVRQNLFTVRGTGYGLCMPLSSDWRQPFNEFLADSSSQKQIAQILGNYLGEDLYQFIDGVEQEEQLGTSILTKEKELQLALIKNANLRLEEEQAFKKALILGIVITGLFLLIIGILFFKNNRKTKILIHQKSQIEDQQRDIHQKNEQLMNRNTQLMSLIEEKNHLVRVMAHDLRSPLQQIIGFADLVKEEARLIDEDKQKLSYIIQASHQMNKMINRILHEEIVEADKSVVLKEPVNIPLIMQELVSRYEKQAADKNIAIILEECDEDCVIKSDHLLIYLILENLLSNAIKFSDKETSVRLSSKCDHEFVTFQIHDQGPGFTEEDKSLAFNRFQKLSARPTGGETSTGLGLSIVKKYVSDLNGKVSLDSEHGKGSTFLVSIPIE
jgi:signal transduction histidine kinase